VEKKRYINLAWIAIIRGVSKRRNGWREKMIKDYLEPKLLTMVERLFEPGVTTKELCLKNSKNPTKFLDELLEAKIAVCDNPEAPLEERTYSGNKNSRIFRTLFAMDLELSKKSFEKRMKARAALFATKKK
jgi:hypothetical protein